MKEKFQSGNRIIKKKNFIREANLKSVSQQSVPTSPMKIVYINNRFNIQQKYLRLQKKVAFLQDSQNLLAWKNLFFLSPTVKQMYKDIDEEVRHKLLTFVFYRSLIRIQRFCRSLFRVARLASDHIKNYWLKRFRHGRAVACLGVQVTLFRNRVLGKKLARWVKWVVKKLRMKKHPFICDRPMKYSLRKLLTI